MCVFVCEYVCECIYVYVRVCLCKRMRVVVNVCLSLKKPTQALALLNRVAPTDILGRRESLGFCACVCVCVCVWVGGCVCAHALELDHLKVRRKGVCIHACEFVHACV